MYRMYDVSIIVCRSLALYVWLYTISSLGVFLETLIFGQKGDGHWWHIMLLASGVSVPLHFAAGFVLWRWAPAIANRMVPPRHATEVTIPFAQVRQAAFSTVGLLTLSFAVPQILRITQSLITLNHDMFRDPSIIRSCVFSIVGTLFQIGFGLFLLRGSGRIVDWLDRKSPAISE